MYQTRRFSQRRVFKSRQKCYQVVKFALIHLKTLPLLLYNVIKSAKNKIKSLGDKK